MRNMRSNPIMKSSLFVGALGALLTAGCVSVLPEPAPPPVIYRLNVPVAVSNTSVNPISSARIVNIEYPLASKMLGGSDIVLSPDGRSLTAAAGAHWSESIPGLLRNALIDKLSQSGSVTGVVPKGSTRVPYRLNTDVRRFEAVFDNGQEQGPLAIVQLKMALTDSKTRQLIGTRTIRTEARASEARVSSIVKAQEQATLDAVEQISLWLGGRLTGRS